MSARGEKGAFLSPLLRIALPVGVCAHLVGFLLFRVTVDPPPQRAAGAPFVRYVAPASLEASAVIEARALLFDSAPLFLPGPWNAAYQIERESRPRGVPGFTPYEPPIDFDQALLPREMPFGRDYGVSEPRDMLALRFWDLFPEIGHDGREVQPFDGAGPFAELRDATGRVIGVAPASIPLLSLQATGPAVFYGFVESSGRLTGRFNFATSSGDPEFDAAARRWLDQSGIAAGLAAGTIRVAVFP